MNLFTNFLFIVTMVVLFDGGWGPQHILKSGKKPVATNLYGNDVYMIHFQTYGC
jgi:hypothetical protein